MEYNIGDRDSFKKFIGIGHADNIPDARTIWKFRERLGDTGTRELFDLFYAYMREKGLQCSKGKIIDATFQEARIQRNTPEENAHIKDTGKSPGGVIKEEESAQGCRSNVYQKRGSKVSRIQGTHYRG